jgi:transcriptional regulator of NAD metabolism
MATGGRQRRIALLEALHQTAAPVTGSELSTKLAVSRQAVVNDIAILRAGGEPIIGGPRGYQLAVSTADAWPVAVLACRHDRDTSRRELEILVGHDLTVIDVVVEHQMYGEVRANLLIYSKADVDKYMQKLDTERAQPLSALTGGVHLHHVGVPSPEKLEAAKRDLAAEGFLLEE